MDESLVRLLNDTQCAHDGPRKSAEWQLKQQYSAPDFSLGLVGIAAYPQATVELRQAALLVLKNFVLACWSEQFEEFAGQAALDDGRKNQVRSTLLDLALSEIDERKIKNAAGLVVSKIASADFPDQWPELLPTVLRVLTEGSEGQMHGALKVLNELVDDCLNQEQFFQVARDLVNAVYGIAANDSRKPTLRALAISVFRSIFDILEMVMEDHKAAVKAFAEETLSGWIPFFVDALKAPLPTAEASGDAAEYYRGCVALKLQVVKALMRVRSLFSSLLSSRSTDLFSATWAELTALEDRYTELYVDNDRQGRLVDADGLPYTLDLLVLEELDFLQACFRAPPVRRELEQQGTSTANAPAQWLLELMKITVAYARITTEEEGLWEIDVNIFLSEETNVTANYTPRTACGDLIIKLGEWMNTKAVEGLLTYTRMLYSGNTSWKAKEAALYLLNQLLGDFQDMEKSIGDELATGYIDLIQHTVQQEQPFLRARGYLVAGSLVRNSAQSMVGTATTFLQASLQAVINDSSDVVKVSCIRALSFYTASLPPASVLPLQPSIIAALVHFVNTQDLGDPNDGDDLLITIIESLRDATLLDTKKCLANGGIDLLFTLASRGASNFQVALLVTETFEEIASRIAGEGRDLYKDLAAKVLPSLMGAFDVASLTEESALADLAAELLAILAEEGLSPLPEGFVSTTLPRLQKLLLETNDEELLKSATKAVKHILHHDPDQVFAWRDKTGKSGLEVILLVIDRLLSPSMDDDSASEVGGLAAEVVEKAGSERLGPYLTQLLRAVAERLLIARQAQSIQSLILVFARLSLETAQDVVTFLADVQIGNENALNIVMTKWLENSINFAGYDEIRQNVIALTKIYELNDPRISSLEVKGDLIVRQSDRIMTRSRARQHPDEYTKVSAQVKIVKVLVEELSSSTTANATLGGAAASNDDDDEESDDDEWEDDADDVLDLNTGMTKSELMALGQEDGPSRGTDNETQSVLCDFFKRAATTAEFATIFASLAQAEQDKLRSMDQV